MSEQGAKQPVLRAATRAVARTLVGAMLFNALGPLSAVAQDKPSVSPAAQRQLQQYAQLNQRLEQAKADQAKTPSERAAEHAKRAEDLVRSLGADARAAAPTASTPQARDTRAIGPDKKIETQRAWRLTDAQRGEQRRQLKEHLQSVREGQAAVRAEFQATGQDLQRKNAPTVILERQQIALAQFEQRSGEFERLSQAWSKDPSDANLSALAEFFERHPAQKRAQPFDAKKLPWSTPKPTTRTPAETKTAWFQQLWGKEGILTAQTTTVGPITFQIPPEPGQTPSEADLASTEDAPISDVVRAQAAELGNNPVAILRWVHNNLEWLPSWGSLQGAESTIVMRRGNAADIASATISLLRAANVPARYVVGTIEVDADRLVNWIGGAETIDAAMNLMQQGGIATVGVTSGGRIAKVRMEHVWLQAYVNWAPSRGAQQGSSTQHVNPVGPHNSWVDIDPSFKQHTFSAPLDIAAAVPLDVNALRNAVTAGAVVNTTTGFVSGIQENAALDQIRAYGQRVQTFLDSRPNLTVPDLVKQREIVSDTAQLLSGVLPNAALTAQVLTALPASMRHAITLKLYASPTDRATGSAALSYRISLPALNYQRIGVTYEAASAADQQVIDSAVAAGATSLPAYLLNVRPVVSLDSAVVATGPTTRMASAQYWTVGFEDPAGASGGEADFSNSAGDELVFGIDANGVSADLVYKRAGQTATNTAQGNLEMAALLYWLEHDLFDQMAAGETKVLTMRMPSVMQMAMPLTTRYFFGVARSASYQSVSGDGRRVLVAAAGKDENARRRFALAAGLQGSAIEGSVLDQLHSRPEETSVSTTQFIAIAMRQGLKLYSVTGENVNAVLPLLAVSQSVKDDIVNAVSSGFVAFVPERDITHKGYTGIGYLLLDPSTGAGAYLIDGGRNGLFTPDCKAKAFVGPVPGVPAVPVAPVNLQSVFRAEELSRALVPTIDTAAETAAEQAAKREAQIAIEKAARSSAQRIAQRVGPRMLVGLLALPPGVNVLLAVALAVVISIEIFILVIEIKMIIEELKLQTKTRTEEDTRCKCELNPSDPACKCQIQPETQKPIRSARPQSDWTRNDRNVDWHHRCADNNSSFPGQDVRVTDDLGRSISFDTFDTTQRLACEVKTTFNPDPYPEPQIGLWRNRVRAQIDQQRAIADQCKLGYCVYVNTQWLANEMIRIGVAPEQVRLRPNCASTPPPPDPSEQPSPELDMN